MNFKLGKQQITALLLTAIMCGQAYLTSARIAAGATGPCEGYAVNEEPFLDVIRMHLEATSRIDSSALPSRLKTTVEMS